MSTVETATSLLPSTPAPRVDDEADLLVQASRERVGREVAKRQRWSSLITGGAFLATAAALAAFVPTDRAPGLLAPVVLVLAYALVARVEFEVGSGVAVPTQLVLVPMLFTLPAGWVPLAVFAGLVLGRTFEPGRRRVAVGRMPLLAASSWHAVGPALVLGLAGEPAPGWNAGLIFAAALAAQFLFDAVVSAGSDWLALGVSPRTHFAFMRWVFTVDAGLAPVGFLLAAAATQHPSAVVLAFPLVALLRVFGSERRARIDQALELSNAYRGTAFLLGDVVEADDEYTGAHSRHVVDLVLDVSDRLGLGPRERRHAEFTALLHDVGKIRIPGEIINKPGALDDAEWAIMKTHTIEGQVMLERVGGLLGEIGRLVRSCHERWDGSGYPDGLAGEQIPLVARIVCCCDAWSAMTTDRPYRAARSTEEALEELHRCSGTHFDPAVVDALAASVTPLR